MKWTPQNKRPIKLKDSLKELEVNEYAFYTRLSYRYYKKSLHFQMQSNQFLQYKFNIVLKLFPL